MKKNYLPLWILLITFISPFIISSVFLYTGIELPFKKKQHGILLQPTLPKGDLFKNENLKNIWVLALKTDKNLEQKIYDISYGLKKEAKRVKFMTLPKDYYISDNETNSLIIDPHGQIVMIYDSMVKSKHIVADLKNLLRFSHAG